MYSSFLLLLVRHLLLLAWHLLLVAMHLFLVDLHSLAAWHVNHGLKPVP